MHSSPLRVYRSLCCAPLRVYITNFIVRAGCSGCQSREDSPSGSAFAGWVRQTNLACFISRRKSAHRKRRRSKMPERTRRGKHASLRAGSSPFLSCTGLPAPCSRRLKVKQAADKKILIKKPPTAKKCETSCAGGRPFFCLFILSALDSMARGKLLRSRSLTRPPLANVAGAATG